MIRRRWRGPLWRCTRRRAIARLDAGNPAGGCAEAVRRRARRLLHHRRRRSRRAAGPAAHRRGQRHASRQRGDGRGVRPAVAPDRRRAGASVRGAAARLHRQPGSARGDADAAGGGRPAGGSRDRGDRRRRRRGVGGRGARRRRPRRGGAARRQPGALPTGHPAFGKPAGRALPMSAAGRSAACR